MVESDVGVRYTQNRPGNRSAFERGQPRGSAARDYYHGEIPRVEKSFALEIVQKYRCCAAAQGRYADYRSLEVVDFLCGFATHQDVRRRIIDAGNYFKVAAFFVDHDRRIGIQAADLEFACEQRRELNVASSNQHRFNLEVLGGIKTLLLADVVGHEKERFRGNPNFQRLGGDQRDKKP